MNFTLVFGLLIASALASASAEQINGQVFIVTKGHESVKLGLVAVAAFDYKDVSDAISNVRERDRPEAEAVNALHPTIGEVTKNAEKIATIVSDDYVNSRDTTEDKMHKALSLKYEAIAMAAQASSYADYLLSGGHFFEHLPSPLATTKTDADGQFSIEVPSDHAIVLGASATRAIASKTETYHWLVRITAPAGKIMLSNDNLTSEHSEDSVLFTRAEDGEKSSAETIKRRLLALRDKALELAGKPQFGSSKGDGLIPSGVTIASATPSVPAAIVTLRGPVKVRVKYGEITLPAGLKLSVVRRDAKFVTAAYNNESVQVPVEALVAP